MTYPHSIVSEQIQNSYFLKIALKVKAKVIGESAPIRRPVIDPSRFANAHQNDVSKCSRYGAKIAWQNNAKIMEISKDWPLKLKVKDADDSVESW